MPELPEVETIRQILEPQIKGLTIRKVVIKRPEVIAYPDAAVFEQKLGGQRIASMTRRGKFLIITLSDGGRLILHLRMTGCLLVTPAGYPEEKHTHLVLQLSQAKELRFSDTRRFGRFWLLEKDEADTVSGLDKLGLEPFDPQCSAQYLAHAWGRRKKAIKECLLEQKVIAGIGNIYADEILFQAKLDPACPAKCLCDEDWQQLAESIPERLTYFIYKNRLTPEAYLAGKGKDYRNTPFLQVYNQEGKPCPNCGEPLRRKVIAGRGSTYCPNCQQERLC